MKPVVVAVIGCGCIANLAHIPSYVKNENAVIKYFCDIIPERAGKAVEEYGCGTAITDYRVILEDPEVLLFVFHLCLILLPSPQSLQSVIESVFPGRWTPPLTVVLLSVF